AIREKILRFPMSEHVPSRGVANCSPQVPGAMGVGEDGVFGDGGVCAAQFRRKFGGGGEQKRFGGERRFQRTRGGLRVRDGRGVSVVQSRFGPAESCDANTVE